MPTNARKITTILFSLIFCCKTFCQSDIIDKAIDVTEQTIKIGGGKEEEILIGFAKGDQIVFNFSEINRKELKEVEILAYPSQSKFSDFKTSKVENKRISVAEQGVYIFRFKNSSLGGRICKIRIQRIPADASTLSFNTAVQWVTKQDTTWHTYTKDVLTGYDTTYQQKTRKERVSSVQREELILDKNQRVHSTTNSNGSRTFVFFTLPVNQQSNNKTTQVVSWAYWIGVDEEGNAAWQKNVQAMKSVVTKGSALFTSPLGALAMGAVAELLTPKLGEDVQYSIADAQNKDLFMAGKAYRGWDHGKGVAGYKKFTDPSICQGTYFICMRNDNIMQGIDANVKVVAIVETKEFKDGIYTEMEVSPKYQKQLFKEPKIRTYQTALTGQ